MTQSQNGQAGISLTQTADAAYAEINDSALRIRELTTQAGNGALNASDRQVIQAEISSLTEHINEVAGNANYAGIDLLSSNGQINIAVGNTPGSSPGIDITTKDVAAQLNAQGFNSIDVMAPGGVASALSVLDTVTELVNTSRAELGASQNRLDSSIRSINNQHENLAAARSRIADADYAASSAQQMSNDILSQGQIAMQGQANIKSQQALDLLA
jgi:flagellin